MKILLINNDGGGFADEIEVSDGITVAELFKKQSPNRKPNDYLIRVNRQPAGSDQVLQPGDRTSFTPIRVEGASA